MYTSSKQMPWKGAGGYFVEIQIQKSYLSPTNQAFAKNICYEFSVPKVWTANWKCCFFPLPIAKSLDLHKKNKTVSYCISYSHAYTPAHLWMSNASGTCVKNTSMTTKLLPLFTVWLLSPSFEVSQQAWPKKEFIPEGRVEKKLMMNNCIVWNLMFPN